MEGSCVFCCRVFEVMNNKNEVKIFSENAPIFFLGAFFIFVGPVIPGGLHSCIARVRFAEQCKCKFIPVALSFSCIVFFSSQV